MVKYKKIMLISLAATILIFISGLILGGSLDDSRINELVENLNQNELNSESYLVEKEFVTNFGGNKCESSKARINELTKELGKLGPLLLKYESKSIFKETEFDYLKRKYFLLEIKTYNLLSSLKKECNYDIKIILFFYDKDDTNSIRQGYILDSLVASNKNLYIFSFDRLFNVDPALETVKIHYNINSSPTLIINNDLKKEGLTLLENLKEILI